MKFALHILITLSVISLSAPKIAVYSTDPKLYDLALSYVEKIENIEVVEREDLKAILKERKLSDYGITEAVEFGKLSSADYVLVVKVKDDILNVKIINVRNGEVVFSSLKRITFENFERALDSIFEDLEYKNGRFVISEASIRYRIHLVLSFIMIVLIVLLGSAVKSGYVSLKVPLILIFTSVISSNILIVVFGRDAGTLALYTDFSGLVLATFIAFSSLLRKLGGGS